MQVRLQKHLADCGVASRRKAEGIIADRRVTVNGLVASLGDKIDPKNDTVLLDGVAVSGRPAPVYIMLHKPAGIITSAADQFGRKTVLDLIGDCYGRLYPVGRLDYGTSGLLLLTNDGDVAYKLTHPAHGISKTYVAKAEKPLKIADIKAIEQGIDIDGRKTRPAKAAILDKYGRVAKITISEGRNRQIRKMFEALGNRVISLKRVSIGQIALGDLGAGQHRRLTPAEIKYLTLEVG